ncbi:hypothetical protein [Wielerella bovis]|uniref:hypothetical protein n=1 Tax=Wielerella bovis TaxID=2917790 RepID=UPI002018B6A0|nr:hypothetical protein [Wielerella bovis]ULJ59950.1 hypothetical protein MIS44_09795 [Wielerella bovis]
MQPETLFTQYLNFFSWRCAAIPTLLNINHCTRFPPFQAAVLLRDFRRSGIYARHNIP